MERHYKLKQQPTNQIKMANAGQGRAKAQYPNEDIYKLFITQGILYSYNNYNIIYNTTEGLFYSSGKNFVDILPYFIKYMKKGDVNTGGQPPKKYIEKINKDSKLQDGKIWLIYVDSRPNHRGQNNLISIDETKFKKHIHSADVNPLVQFTAMMMRMNANIR